MSEIDFAHIIPWRYLDDLSKYNRAELVLAHVADSNPNYSAWYERNPSTIYNKVTNDHYTKKRIMDNGAFELGESMDPTKLINLAKRVNATHIVLPDYPGDSSLRTFKAAREWATRFKLEGFDTVFVPQGLVGNIADYDRSVRNGLDLYFGGLVDVLALSIIGVPTAFDCYNNLTQRTLARWHYLSSLPDRHFQLFTELTNKQDSPPIHMLGMLDGPNEISLIKQLISLPEYNYNIVSWDSSAAVWYGLNNIGFDNSPTGSLTGKYTNHVDFDFYTDDPNLDLCVSNIEYINTLCNKQWEINL